MLNEEEETKGEMSARWCAMFCLMLATFKEFYKKIFFLQTWFWRREMSTQLNNPKCVFLLFTKLLGTVVYLAHLFETVLIFQETDFIWLFISETKKGILLEKIAVENDPSSVSKEVLWDFLDCDKTLKRKIIYSQSVESANRIHFRLMITLLMFSRYHF